MLKKLMSLLTSAAVIGTTLVSVAVPSVVSATETENGASEPIVVFQRTFEKDESGNEVGYIHDSSKAIYEHTGGAGAYPAQARIYDYNDGNNTAMSLRNNVIYGDYFTRPYTAGDGVLHFRYKMKAKNLANSQKRVNYLYGLKSNGGDVGTNTGFTQVNNDFRFVGSDQRYGTKIGDLHARTGGTYDSTTDTWSGGTTKGDGPTVYNTIEGYIDLTAKKIGIILNENIAAILKVDNTLNNTSIPNITTITGMGFGAGTKEEIVYDDLYAEIIPGKSLADYFYSEKSFNTLANGGIENETFEGDYFDISSLGPDSSSEVWTKAKLASSFRYDFGETLTAETEKTLYLKYNFALDPDITYGGTEDEGAYLGLYNGTTGYYFANLFHYNSLRGATTKWNAIHTGAVKATLGTTKNDYKYQIEAYIDLSSGKAAIKYGTDGKFALTDIPAALIANGISYIKGAGNKQYLDDVTVKGYAGNIYDVTAAHGIDLGVASLPALYDYENSTAATTVVLATTDNAANKAHSISPSNPDSKNLTIPFRDVVKEGKLYIGFDYAEKAYESEQATSGSGKRYFMLRDAAGNNYRIAGINLTHVGMQSYSSDWQANTGYKELDRTVGVWNRIDMVIDFENKVMSGYLNGNLLAQVAMVNASLSADWSGLLENGASAFYVASESITNSEYCLDNIKMTSFTEGFTVDASMKDAQNVDVEFGTSLSANELLYYTTAANWNNATITSVTQITPSKLRLNLSSAVADTAYHYITLPDFVQNGIARKAEGVANVALNDNLICYTNNALNLKSTSFTGCDGNATYPLSVEPGTTVVNLVFNGAVAEDQAVTLKQGENVLGTATYNGKKCTITLNTPLVEKTTYTITFTNGGETYNRTFTTAAGKFVVTDYALVDANGKETSDFTNGGILKLTVKNTTTAPQSVQAIVAGYGAYNKMFKAIPEEVTAEAYKAVVDKEIPFDFGDDAASVTLVKALFWNNFEEILPLAERMEVTVETTVVE